MAAAQRHYPLPQPEIEFLPSRNTPFNKANEPAQLTLLCSRKDFAKFRRN